MHRGKVRALAISTDGRLAATAGADGRIRVVDLATKKPVADAAHDVVTVGFSADGKTLRAVTAQGELLALDPKNGALRTKLPCPDRRRTSGAFIFGDLIVQAYEDG